MISFHFFLSFQLSIIASTQNKWFSNLNKKRHFIEASTAIQLVFLCEHVMSKKFSNNLQDFLSTHLLSGLQLDVKGSALGWIRGRWKRIHLHINIYRKRAGLKVRNMQLHRFHHFTHSFITAGWSWSSRFYHRLISSCYCLYFLLYHPLWSPPLDNEYSRTKYWPHVHAFCTVKFPTN